MKEHHFIVNDDTPPDFETEAGKWWLCEKGEKYSIWRFDSKTDPNDKAYLILRNTDSVVIAGDYTIEGVSIKHDLLENFY